MDFQTYTRKPFDVEAVQITEDNIDEIGEMIGKVMTSTKGKYIIIDRLIIPNVPKAYVGWWLTRMGTDEKKLHCYADRVFQRMFSPFNVKNKELSSYDVV